MRNGYYHCNSDIYNALGMVVEVDERVRRNGALNRFLEEAGPLFLREGLEHIAGVALLHKHNDIGAEDAMIQGIEEWNGKEALVCKRTCVSGKNNDMFPMNFAVSSSGDLTAIEYSSSPNLEKKINTLLECKRFISGFAHLAERRGMLPDVGISIATRDLFSNLDPTLVPLEVCDIDRQANILSLISPEEFSSVNTMQTNWFFSASPVGGCKIICAYRCFERSPGHSREHAGQTHAIDT